MQGSSSGQHYCIRVTDEVGTPHECTVSYDLRFVVAVHLRSIERVLNRLHGQLYIVQHRPCVLFTTRPPTHNMESITNTASTLINVKTPQTVSATNAACSVQSSPGRASEPDSDSYTESDE